MIDRRFPRPTCALVLALVLASAGASAQQTENPAKVQAARDLADKGYELFVEERYEEALDRLERAYQMVGAPTILVLMAEALERLGRLIEAREAYETVGRLELGEDAPPAFVKAQGQAAASYLGWATVRDSWGSGWGSPCS